jgi:hypothetical protein
MAPTHLKIGHALLSLTLLAAQVGAITQKAGPELCVGNQYFDTTALGCIECTAGSTVPSDDRKWISRISYRVSCSTVVLVCPWI